MIMRLIVTILDVILCLIMVKVAIDFDKKGEKTTMWITDAMIILTLVNVLCVWRF